MYRSAGRAIHGFEMKVSRQDWLKELKQPEKSESLLRFCDTWSLIASTESIVHDGELPPLWGFGIPHRARSNASWRIKWLVKPPELKPMPYDIVFLTALIASAQAQPGIDARKLIDESYKQGQAYSRSIIANRETKITRLEKIIETFSHASGVQLSSWMADSDVVEAAAAYKEFRLTRHTLDNKRMELQDLYHHSERITNGIRKVLKIEESNGTTIES